MGAFAKTMAGILLLCVVGDPFAGSLVWLQYKKSLVRREVEKHIVAGMEDDDMVMLRFSREEARMKLRWEHHREFEYNRQMYDVVERTTVGDTIYFRCLWDKKETRLKRRMEELALRVVGKGPKIGEKSPPLISFDKSLYCGVPLFKFSSMLEFREKIPEKSAAFYFSISGQPPTPPPRLRPSILT